MIKVVPPKGWVIPQRESSESKPPQNKEATLNSLPPSAADSGKATDSNFDFEDIDQLLAQPGEVKSASQASASLQSPPDQQASVETGAPEKKTKRSQVAETSLGSATDSARPVDPMLPNQQWESDESKSKKRLVRTLALVLGTVLLGGFILALTIANRNKPPIPVAENAVDDDVDEVNKDAQPAESQDDIEPKTVETEAISKQVTQNPPSPTSDTDPEPDPSTSIAPTAPPQLPGTATQLPTAEPTTADPTKEDPSKQSPQLPSPFRNAETEAPASVSPEPAKQQSAMGMVAKIENQMGDLAGLLEKSGASLSDLRDVAFEASGQTVVGMPKYVIEKPGTMKTDLARLDLNVGGLLLEDTPLPVVVRELTSISGVPITIDARSIEAAGVDVNQPVSLTITDSALNTAMDQILTPLGIVKQTDSVGLKFTVANSLELELASYSLAEFADLDEQAKKSFLAYIQAMIDPQIWVRDLNPATIELQGDDIVVSCPAQSHTQIKRMVAKLKSANALIADPTDPAAMAQTLTRSGAIISKLEAPIETNQTIRTPIGLFFTKLQKKSGVTVLVDWENISKEGWTPQTLIPGSIDEPTAGDIVKQLAQSMSLSVVAVDQNTLLLTTVSKAASAGDIEVYSVAKLLAGKFDENQLKELFETTLGFHLRSAKYVYDASCQCFIVAAPQSKQRQVEALLKRLEGF